MKKKLAKSSNPKAKDLISLADSLAQLASLEGIGQAEFMALDPLALRNLLLAQLARLAPAPGIRPFQGHMLSADEKHVLVVATPARASTGSTRPSARPRTRSRAPAK